MFFTVTLECSSSDSLQDVDAMLRGGQITPLTSAYGQPRKLPSQKALPTQTWNYENTSSTKIPKLKAKRRERNCCYHLSFCLDLHLQVTRNQPTSPASNKTPVFEVV
eukprot:5854836-Amphidinium_carterae.2